MNKKTCGAPHLACILHRLRDYHNLFTRTAKKRLAFIESDALPATCRQYFCWYCHSVKWLSWAPCNDGALSVSGQETAGPRYLHAVAL